MEMLTQNFTEKFENLENNPLKISFKFTNDDLCVGKKNDLLEFNYEEPIHFWKWPTKVLRRLVTYQQTIKC